MQGTSSSSARQGCSNVNEAHVTTVGVEGATRAGHFCGRGVGMQWGCFCSALRNQAFAVAPALKG